MKLRPYRCGEDFSLIESWITGERTHALWCAGRFPWPLTRVGFEGRLKELAEKSGDIPLVGETVEGESIGFVCFSPGPAGGEGKLKFVLVDPEKRSLGLGWELVTLAAEYGRACAGAETVRLSVFTVNAAAIRCYERAGFASERTEEGVYAFHEERWGRRTMALRL